MVKGVISMEKPKHILVKKTVKKIAKFLEIPRPKVMIKPPHKFPNPNISSFFDIRDYSITFNDVWMRSVQDLEIIATAFHETRHLYQKYCVDQNAYEDQALIKTWKDNFDAYKSPLPNEPNGGFEYLAQPVEIDAIAFAIKCMSQFHQVRLYTPEEVKREILIRQKNLKLPNNY
jgi:hypothetical protein